MQVAKVSFLFSANCQFDKESDQRKVTGTHNNMESEEESWLGKQITEAISFRCA